MSLDRSLLSFLPSASRISLTCFLASVFARAVGAGEPCHYTWIQIPNPPGWKCNSQAINNHGHVAGYLYNAGDFYRGFIWTPETGTVMLPRPAGVPSMQVYDLNDHGQAVGELQEVPNLGKVPFIWDGEQVEVIFMPAGSRNGHAWSINNLGQVVGQYEAPGLAGLHAFLWEDGVFTDLAPIIGAGSSIAWSIDDRSRIAGRTYVGSNQRAFRLELNKLDLFPLPPQLVSSECGEISGGAFAVGWGAPAPPGDPDYLVSGVIWAPGQTYVIGTGVPGQHILFSGVNESGRAVGSRGFGFYVPLIWQSGVAAELGDLMVPQPPAGMEVTFGSRINRRGQIAISRVTSVAEEGVLVLSPQWLTGDLTGDCQVSFSDLAVLLSHFGSGPEDFPAGDTDGDGDVDLGDLALLLSHFGQ